MRSNNGLFRFCDKVPAGQIFCGHIPTCPSPFIVNPRKLPVWSRLPTQQQSNDSNIMQEPKAKERFTHISPPWRIHCAFSGGYLCSWFSTTLNRRCTRLPGCIGIRNDLCVLGGALNSTQRRFRHRQGRCHRRSAYRPQQLCVWLYHLS